MRKINFLNLLGYAGSGKTTLKKLLLTFSCFVSYVPTTTRPPRKGEVNGQDYWFIGVDEYLADQTMIIKRVVDAKTMYGVRRKDIDALPSDRIIVVTMDSSGVKALEQLGYTGVVVYLKFSEQTRIYRMIRRGDCAHCVYKRLQYDRKHCFNFDFNATVIEVNEGNPTEIKDRVMRILSTLQQGVIV